MLISESMQTTSESYSPKSSLHVIIKWIFQRHYFNYHSKIFQWFSVTFMIQWKLSLSWLSKPSLNWPRLLFFSDFCFKLFLPFPLPLNLWLDLLFILKYYLLSCFLAFVITNNYGKYVLGNVLKLSRVHLICPHKNTMGYLLYYSYFTDEKTEAQRGCHQLKDI